MLENQRFDYLPLSILDVVDLESSLMRTDSVYLYYPLPICVLFSTNKPIIAERLTRGLNEVFKNGKEEVLFQGLFKHNIDLFLQSDAPIFILQNPEYNSRQNIEMSEKFLDEYKVENRAIWLQKGK